MHASLGLEVRIEFEMARPVKLGALLGKLKKDKTTGEDGLNKIVKPKLASKNDRSVWAKELKNDYSRNNNNANYDDVLKVARSSISKQTPQETNSKDLQTQSEVSRRSNKSKFQFNWDLKDDTTANYEPILSPSILNKSLKNTGQSRDKTLDSLENVYMGKHWTDKTYEEMTDRDWRILNEEFHITTKGENMKLSPNSNIKHSLRNWHELDLIPKEFIGILTNKLHFKDPTPIQRVSIPNIACTDSKRDLLGVSATGSGKTLAFVIPILIKLYNDQIRPHSIKVMEGPKALILAPTRELAQQIERETQNFTSFWDDGSCQVTSIVGGHSIEEITHNVSKGCDILVATPGRLIDCLQSHVLSINMIDFLVLDEADKMIDLGFEDQIKTILNQINVENDRVVRKMLFTATLSASIQSIAASYMENPIYVMVDSGENQAPKIQQIVDYTATDALKFQRLKNNILPTYKAPIIIFINYKTTADWLARKFQDETRFKFTILHGSKTQEQREHSLSLLRNGKADIMIATNVAARGLDIPNVSLVVNYQMSKNFDDYVHRIGRTGRAGNFGTAITFLDGNEDEQVIRELYDYTQENNTTGKNKFSPHIKETFKLGKNGQFKNIIY